MLQNKKIPNIFHFVFGLREQTEPFHLAYYLCLKSCLEVQKPDAIYFHYQNKPWGYWWERIEPLLILKPIETEAWLSEFVYQDKTLAPYRYAHYADFARLKALKKFGGFYADIDSIFIRPFPDSWFTQDFIIGEEKSPYHNSRSLCNAWLASAKDSAFCSAWLEQMYSSFDGSWSNHSTLLPFKLSKKHPDWLHIEPETSFYALDWTGASINRLFIHDQKIPENSYSLHLWEHMWWNKKQTAFSVFHEGCLTADYVAFAPTTYARLARGFLPKDTTVSRQAYQQQARKWKTHYWINKPFYLMRLFAQTLYQKISSTLK